MRSFFMAAMLLVVILIAGMAGNGCIEDIRGLPEAAFVGAPLSGYAPLHVDFADRSQQGDSPIHSWKWSFGDGNSGTLRNPSHVYEKPGLYNVSLRVSNQRGSHQVERSEYIAVYEPLVKLERYMDQDAALYQPGDSIEITLRLEAMQAFTLRALGIREDLPPGWEVTGYTVDSEADVIREVAHASALEILWLNPPELPLEFSYVARVPEEAFGAQTLSGEALFRDDAEELRSNIARTTFQPSNEQ